MSDWEAIDLDEEGFQEELERLTEVVKLRAREIAAELLRRSGHVTGTAALARGRGAVEVVPSRDVVRRSEDAAHDAAATVLHREVTAAVAQGWREECPSRSVAGSAVRRT